MFIIPYIQWVLLALVKSGDYDRASSVLQEKCTDLDLNCRDYVSLFVLNYILIMYVYIGHMTFEHLVGLKWYAVVVGREEIWLCMLR